MRWIVGSSLKFRRLLVALAFGLIAFGVTQLGNIKMDTLPEFNRPTVEVQTEALGLSAEEVEQLITVPLEQDLLNGVAFLDEIESASLPGLSSVVLTFQPGTNLMDARQVVAERLTQAVGVAGLPEVAKPPQMLQPLSSTSRVSMVKLSSEELSPIEMSVLARWVIVPRLVGVDGVANVAIWGFRDRQLQVQVDPARLVNRNISLEQIIRTAGNALEVSPLTFLEASSPGTGGFIDTVNQRLHIFHEQAISTPQELAQVTIEDPQGGAEFERGRPVTLGEMTQIVEDHQPLIGDALCSDGPCLLLVVEKFPEANTPEVTRGVDTALDALRPGLPGIQIDTSIYRPANYIEQSLDNLGVALLIGGILLLLLLGVFFVDWRASLIAALAVVLSLTVAGLVLYLGGTTIHAMTLIGLIIALTALIDDAITGIDNVARRLREHRSVGGGIPMWRVVIDATVEMRTGMLYATVIVIAALVPAFFMEAEPGAFFPSVAVTYVLAIAASTLVALTVTPALAMMVLTRAPLARRESPVVSLLQRSHASFAGFLVRRKLTAAIFAVFLLSGLLAVPFLDLSLRPSLKERDVLVQLDAAPGTSLPRMDQITADAVNELRVVPGVANVGAHVGRAVMSDQVVNVNSAEIWINLERSADYDATLNAIQDIADRNPEVTGDVLTYSGRRITDVLQRNDDEVVVRVYGQDRDVLQSKAEEVHRALGDVEGLEEPRVELTSQEPTLEVEVDLARAQAVGVKPGDVRRQAATLLGGIVVGNLFEQQKIFDVVVWGTPNLRQSPDQVGGLLIEAPGGRRVRLDQIANVRVVPNVSVIRHESVERYVDVTASVAGRSTEDVLVDVENAVAEVEFPAEHHAEVLGGLAEQQSARTRLISIAVAALIGIFLLLQAAFSSWRVATAVFLTLPMALVGGLLATLLDGGLITLGSVAGLIAVLGLAVSNGILLIRRYQRLERHEGRAFGPELVFQGTQERVGPIILTALASAAVLLPIVIAGDAVGFEVVRPAAVAMLGGLVTSTLLNLVVLPVAYLRHGFVAEPDLAGEEVFPAFEGETIGAVGEPR
jgi:Cu/Ag efflux pump CusA